MPHVLPPKEARYTSNYQDPRINELLKAIWKPITEEQAFDNAVKIVEIMSERELQFKVQYFKRGAIFAAVITSLMFITYLTI